MENKTLEQLSLLDSFLFGSTLSYKDYGKEVSHIILKTILGRDVKIRAVNPEKVIFPSKPGLHGVRLDAFIEEEGTDVAPGSIYDLEPEKKAGEKSNLPKRIRYYHSKIDINNLHASEKYKKLPQVWVIFITSFDPFGKNRLVYTIKNHCVELPDMDYDDGATTLLLYVDGDPENYSKDLVQLLTYMKNSIPENACNPDLKELHSYIDKVKKDPNVQEVYMTFEEYVEREKEEERKRADAAEKAAAEANDRAYKADQRIVTSIRKLMNVSGSSPDDAMDTLGIEADMRDYYKAML